MILIGVMRSKLIISNLQDRHMSIVVTVSIVLALSTIGVSLLSLSGYSLHAYASVVEFPNSKITWYDKALAVNQNNVPALVEKGTDLVSQGKGEQAITWLDKALTIDPTNLMALVSKGAALRELGQYPDAIAMYDRVLAVDPHDIYAIGGKADSLFGSGEHQQAVAWIDKALESDPNNGRILQVKETLQQGVN
jgi:tetratricopeptide (TPR) repeat protein